MSGSRPILLTAPCGTDASWQGRLVPFPIGSGAPRPVDGAGLADLHGRYSSITREVATEEGCDLVDLEALFGKDRARLFDDPAADPVHPNAAGMRRIEEALAARIRP